MSEDAGVASHLTPEYVERLQRLVAIANDGNQDEIDSLVSELATLRESQLFQDLGKMTREIHDSLQSFAGDERIVQLAATDVPDAKERLRNVVEKTNESAHRTLTAIEESTPLINAAASKGKEIRERWGKFKNRDLSLTEFKELSVDLEVFFEQLETCSDTVSANLTEILMAQEYQDITGQVIGQVITMVQEVEEKLVNLVAITGGRLSDATKKEVDGSVAEGPQLESASSEDVAKGQDDVDDILASLGF
ncbi:MAG: protein phosphatase CheZ [Gammaproteobacteria bacterium]|nr:protein phosphatase CheZ [Gammaproteobacteria bacterium]